MKAKTSLQQRLDAAQRACRAIADQAAALPAERQTDFEEALGDLRAALEDLSDVGEALQLQLNERTRAEETLRGNTEQFGKFFDINSDGALLHEIGADRLPGKILRVNDAACTLLGRPREELVGRPLKSFISPRGQETDAAGQVIEKLVAQGHNVFESEVLASDGTRVMCEVNATLLELGGRTVSLSLARDITERKLTEAALWASEEKYRALVESAGEAISTIDRNGKFLFMNTTAAERLGGRPADFVGKTMWDLFPKEMADRQFEIVKRVMESGEESVADTITAIRGEPRWYSVGVTPLRDESGETTSAIVLARDITYRQRTEEALRQSELLYRTTIEAISEPIHVVDADLRMTLVNTVFSNWCKELDLAPPEIGASLFDAFGFLTPKVRDEYRRVFDTAQPLVTDESTTIHGQEIITETQKIPIMEGDQVVRVLTVVRNVTEQRKAQQTLRASEERYRQLVEQSPDAVVVAVDGKVAFANAAAATMVCAPKAEDLVGRTMGSSVHPEDRELALARLDQVFQRKKKTPPTEFRLLRRDGTCLEAEASGTPVTYRRRPAVHLVIRDIRERKQALRELERSHAQLRELGARLAEATEAERRRLARELHDRVGQGLTALGINLNFVKNKLPPDPPDNVAERLDAALQLAEETGESIRNVMTDLRPPVLDDYGLAAALRWYAGQLSRRVDVAVVVQAEDLNPRLPQEAETALFRVAQEACNNALKHACAKTVTFTLSQEEDTVRLIVADNGKGFDVAATRRPDAPPRWGLLTMRERARAVGGRARVGSAKGKGTRVTIEVPR